MQALFVILSLAVTVAVPAQKVNTELSYRITQDGQIAIGPGEARLARKTQGVITGVVTDVKTSKPIEGVSVSLNSVSNRGVTTGEDGTYRLSGVANGTHTVTVRIIGYAKQTKTVTIAEGATVSADFKLEPSASVLDQVIVTGTAVATERKAVPTSMSVFTAKDIEERGITDIGQLFRGEVPGLFMQQDMATGGVGDNPYGRIRMFARGISAGGASSVPNATPSPIKTYVDGIEMADAEFLNTIDPKFIERIEILNGPQASTIYGSGAITGVMQIFTKKGTGSTKPQVTLSLQSGLLENNANSSLTPNHDYSAQITGGGQQISYVVGGGYAHLGEWSIGLSPTTYSGYGSVQRTKGIVKAEVSARMNKRETGRLFQNSTSVYVPGIARGELAYTTNFIFNNEDYPTVNGKMLGGIVSVDVLPNWQHKLTVGADESNSVQKSRVPKYTNPNDTIYFFWDRIQNKVTTSYNTTIAHSFGSSLAGTLTAGADYMRYRVSSKLGNRTARTTGNVGFTVSPAEVNKGYYAQGQMSVSDALFLTVGLRREDNTNYGKNYTGGINPRYGVSLVKGVGSLTGKLRASYGTGTRTPEPGRGDAVFGTQIFYPAGYMVFLPNPDLQPERQRGPEYGLELYAGDRASLQITRYDQTVEKQNKQVLVDSVRSILPDASLDCGTPKDDGYCYSGQAQWLNLGSVRNRGWESQGEFRLNSRISLGGTWSYNQSRLQELEPGYKCTNISGGPGACFFVGGSWFNFPEHTAAGRLTYHDKQTNVLVSVSHVGQRIFSNDLDRSRLASAGRIRTYISKVTTGSTPIALPGYQEVDVQANRELRKNLQLLLKINNALDTYEKDVPSAIPVMGRLMSVGVKWTLQ